MKGRLQFIFTYLFFWFVLFIIGKFIFLLYQFNQSFALPIADWFRIYGHGLRLDFSTLGYFSLIPVLILSVTSFWKGKTAWHCLNVYTIIAIILFLMVSITDLVIFRAWSVHLDYLPLQYLVSPKEVTANLSWYYFLILLAVVSLFFYLLYSFYRRRIASLLLNASNGGWKSALLFLFFLLLLFPPIRGGLRTTPINVSSAYFHKNIFANQAAINPLWYFGHSVVEGKETRNPYAFFKEKGYEKDLEQLYSSTGETDKVLNREKPVIILVVMETFTAKLVESLGGPPDVTPQFNRWSREGILFTHVYANGTRTDRGLLAIISGFPTVEPLSVLKYPEKTNKMTYLSRDLIRNEYNASFYYGGDVDFANMKSYLMNGGFHRIVSEKDFSSYHGYRSNWGVPDHVVYDTLLSDVISRNDTGFYVMLTLSHHEPFNIPGEPHFPDGGFANKFYSSAYYADSCLGDFLHKMKSSERWNDCLIVIVADHGSPFPEFSQYQDPAKYKIPMLWLGGALKKDSVVSKYCSQSDIAVTLLHQLGIDNNNYVLGKDILSPSSGSFTFYSFKDGMAMMSDSVQFGLDFISGNTLFSSGPVTDREIYYAKALQQFIYSYYLTL
ncbi:MAG: synthase family protein [Bacteroidetes bacterium]|nr:synthase family protein [Bacteroidota bacterium]